MQKINIQKSDYTAPDIDSLWLKDGKLYQFINNDWREVGNLDRYLPKMATNKIAGVVKKANKENLLNKDAELNDVINKINSLITKLQAAGLMA